MIEGACSIRRESLLADDAAKQPTNLAIGVATRRKT